MNRCPYFQFFPADFLVGTATMSAEGVGAYIVLLCHAWEGDGLEDNMPILRRLTGASDESITEAKAKFELADDGRLRKALTQSMLARASCGSHVLLSPQPWHT